MPALDFPHPIADFTLYDIRTLFQFQALPPMPRSRKRHHSRSRSRSHSHDRREDRHRRDSHDKDRDGKRRKVDCFDSPHQKRSVSAEPEAAPPVEQEVEDIVECKIKDEDVKAVEDTQNVSELKQDIVGEKMETEETENSGDKSAEKSTEPEVKNEDNIETVHNKDSQEVKVDLNKSLTKKVEDSLKITPKKVLSPKQLQKKLESEKKRAEKQKEREEKKQKELEEKEKIKQEKEKLKQEKLKKKQELLELKQKEKEVKEQRRKEKEEKEEQKRKEKEMEKLKKQQELEEKNKEKQKIEEKKQKTSAAFVNFFVAKKPEQEARRDVNVSNFMPFEVKSDMRLPPRRRDDLSEEEKENLDKGMEEQNEEVSYLKELKVGRSCGKTWPFEENSDDVVVVEEDGCGVLGETICEDERKEKLKAKFLKFHENQRPAYFGTWRKKSKKISGRRPFGEDRNMFDYEVDSDEDWEEEEQGESLNGSDDEDKENEPEDDYEVDNEFFVPHGHLSEDEIDEEENNKLSPESLKQKLKLLKDEFDQDMQSKTQKLKPRSIGCIWYNKEGTNVEEAIDKYLKPLAMICNGRIVVGKRQEIVGRKRQVKQEMNPSHVPILLKIVDGSTERKKELVDKFSAFLAENNSGVEITRSNIGRWIKDMAKCVKSGDGDGKKMCWVLKDDFKAKYGFNNNN